MKKLFVLVLLSGSLNCFSQDWPLKKIVRAKKESGVKFTVLPVLSFVTNKTLANLGTYQQLKLDASFVNQVMKQRPEALLLSIPVGNGKSINCELLQFSLGNIKFTENNSSVLENIKIPLTYRGIIAGEQKMNTVVLTVNDDYMALVASMPDKNIQITQADENDKTLYRLYNSETILFPSVAVDCGTKNSPVSKTANGIDLTGVQVNPLGVQDKCVNVFVDCSDSMYQWRQSNPQQVAYYVYELFNLVAGGYLNEQINIQITTINIWTTASPYRATTREIALTQIANYWKDNFWGNICVGLDFSLNRIAGIGRSGIAGDIGRVKAISANTCPAYDSVNNRSACCYNDLNYGGIYSGFPTGPNTSQSQLYLVMHEIGHLLGSSHTHWCGWKLSSNPDVFGAIDSCAAPEGPCMQGPPPAGGRGTMMSYCNGNVGVNYYNGFGVLPGNAIRNFVEQSVCILTCVECFGLRINSNLDGYAFQNTSTVLMKENSTGGNKQNEPIKSQATAGELFIDTKKLKQ